MGKMPFSQNGYSANDRNLIHAATVFGTDVVLTVRKGPAGDLLLAAAARWHKEIEPLRAPDGVLDCWGYAERTVRGSADVLSNHASGTAIDLRARSHPLGVGGTFTASQRSAIHRVISACAPCLRWGGDYTGRVDEMHLEVVASEAACTVALRAFNPAAAPLEDDAMSSIAITPDAGGRFHCADGAGPGRVDFGSTYGGTIWTVAALGGDGKVLGYWPAVRTTNNTGTSRNLPAGTTVVTTEGQVDNAGTRPWARTYLAT